MARSRRDDRRHALTMLYEADMRGHEPGDVLARRRASDEPPAPFAATLVEGVAGDRARLDRLIDGYARGWTVARMPVVDRNLLRLALWELTSSDVPVAVVIDEAVALANELSTPDSGRFVNGVLAAVAREEPAVAAARADAEDPRLPSEPAGGGA